MEVSPMAEKKLALYCKIAHKMHRSQNIAKENQTIGGDGRYGHVHNHGQPVVVAISGGPPLLFFFSSGFLLQCFYPWYLLCYAHVGSSWTTLGIFFDPLGLKTYSNLVI